MMHLLAVGYSRMEHLCYRQTCYSALMGCSLGKNYQQQTNKQTNSNFINIDLNVKITSGMQSPKICSEY